jgi:hypothetical protein
MQQDIFQFVSELDELQNNVRKPPRLTVPGFKSGWPIMALRLSTERITFG